MSNVPPPPPPGGGFPPPPPPGGGFPPPTPPGGDPFGQPQPGAFAGYQAPVGGSQLAGFWVRFGAMVIDILIVACFSIPSRIVAAVGPSEPGFCGDINGGRHACDVPSGGTVAIVLVLNLIAFVAGVIYYAKLEGQGATVGKKALNIRVIDMETGGPIGTARGVGRYFARILSGIPCFLGYFWMLWDDRNQTWHDKLVRSVVVRDQ